MLVRLSANVVSLYFKLNCGIKLNTALLPHWLSGFLFDRTRSITSTFQIICYLSYPKKSPKMEVLHLQHQNLWHLKGEFILFVKSSHF